MEQPPLSSAHAKLAAVVVTNAAAPSVGGAPAKYGATSTDDVQEWSPSGDASKRVAALWKWNLGCGVAHLVQGVAMIALSQASSTGRDFKLPLISNYADWTNGFPRAASTQRALLPFAPVTAVFSLLSALAHVVVLAAWSTYVADLKKGLNRFRWIEYGASSSLMIAQIAMLYGMYDVLSLVLLMAVNCCMNLFGLLHEIVNAGRAPADVEWTAFWAGSFAGAAAWAAVFASVFGAPGVNGAPGFVWAILGVYFAMFQLFPVRRRPSRTRLLSSAARSLDDPPPHVRHAPRSAPQHPAPPRPHVAPRRSTWCSSTCSAGPTPTRATAGGRARATSTARRCT